MPDCGWIDQRISQHHFGDARDHWDLAGAIAGDRDTFRALGTFRSGLLDPRMIERALAKLERRLIAQPDSTRLAALRAEQHRPQLELSRLAAALASGGNLMSLVTAVRERESRLTTLAYELERVRAEETTLGVDLAIVMPEVRRRLDAWQSVLMDESTQVRQMLRRLLKGRLVFTPDLEHQASEFMGQGDLSEVFRGLVTVPRALASPRGICSRSARTEVEGFATRAAA